MSPSSPDKNLVTTLANKLKVEPKDAEYNKQGRLRKLDLSELGLNELPPEIGQLAYLQELILSKNNLTMLPPEIGRLNNLRRLALDKNQLTTLPPALGRLTRLKILSLADNPLPQLPAALWQLSKLCSLTLDDLPLGQIPPELFQLTDLHYLHLRNNQLRYLPPEIGRLNRLLGLTLADNQLAELPAALCQLANLEYLHLGNNELRQLPTDFGRLHNLMRLYLYSNQLTQLPPDFCQLVNLHILESSNNQLTQLPPNFGQLTKLQLLSFHNNRLTELPPDFCQLTGLKILDLAYNQLTHLPPNLPQLKNLHTLSLAHNQLSELPSDFCGLPNLQILSVSNNQLQELPPDFARLTTLQILHLADNQLNRLPPDFHQFKRLQLLSLEHNPNLRTPPPEIAAQGTGEVLDYLRDLRHGSVTRYEAKLLLVGEGRAGKTSLLRALQGQPFDSNLNSTHGIDVRPYALPHPHHPHQTLTLNTWDFGGQHIYQTTHQFFLTKRSLYLMVWNAGVGVEQAGLDKWLKNIQVVAPDSPVLLVATHIDQRQPDLNYQALKARYPQLAGHYAVSNKTGQGVDTLKTALAQTAAQLSLMEQQWPQSWAAVEQALLNRPEHHIDLDKYMACCRQPGLKADIARATLSSYLHDLGKILHFQDDDLLSNLIVLKPNWITKAISRVLTDEPTRQALGILSHADLSRLWAQDDSGVAYERHLYPIFLRLMERFDLSYQLESDVPGKPRTHSLIPLLLPYQPPANLPPWPEKPLAGQTQVEMIYRLDFAPPGIMSWFLVRTHRYTSGQHWREGVVLAYKGHQARVELNPVARELRLVAWGPQPQNFFTILRETLDLILARFEGLKIEREVPCICHWQQDTAEPCPRFYRYADLVRRMEAEKYTVECPDSFADVSVPTLLYGIHASTEPQVVADIRDMKKGLQELLDGQETILERLQQQSELIVRNFTRQWNLEMKKFEAECPNTFILMPGADGRFDPKNWVSQEYLLYLVCQHPSAPHLVGQGYPLRQAEQWWLTLSPWLGHLLKFLHYGLPVGDFFGLKDMLGWSEEALKKMDQGIKMLELINSALPQLSAIDSLERVTPEPRLGVEIETVGPALRALYHFLKEADPAQKWGGLHKTVTPDGNILWLCQEHRQPYLVEPLVLER
ncbi:MAG: leucine-rich repeat domain-containing protein [Anaerolineae bacterium]|nr:leucine-rich repeat domain-containing protein [Anaerolineae bacterium]